MITDEIREELLKMQDVKYREICDQLSPKVFSENKAKLIPFIREWISSDHRAKATGCMDA